jgi:hypothetical protein
LFKKSEDNISSRLRHRYLRRIAPFEKQAIAVTRNADKYVFLSRRVSIDAGGGLGAAHNHKFLQLKRMKPKIE